MENLSYQDKIFLNGIYFLEDIKEEINETEQLVKIIYGGENAIQEWK